MTAVQHDIDSERRLLATCLIEPEATAIAAERVSVEHLYLPAHRVVFQAMLSVAERGVRVSIQPVIDELDDRGELAAVGGILAVTRLVAEPVCVEDLEYLAGRVRALAMKRGLAAAGAEIARIASNGLAPQEALERARAVWDRATTDAEAPESHGLGETVDEVWHALDGQDQSAPGITSGFRDIDGETDGWQPGDLAVVAGAPGLGKTTLLLHFALAAARSGTAVLYLSMEMPRGVLTRRLLASVGGLPEKTLRRPTPTADIAARLAMVSDQLRPLPLTFSDTLSGPTLAALRGHVVSHRRRQRCDLLIVDQLGNLRAMTREGRTQQVSELSGGLKRMAGELGLPILAAHQFNREGARADVPLIQHLRDSGSVEQDADVVMLLSARWEEAQVRGPVDVVFGKNRRGARNRRVQLYYDATQTRFAPSWSR